MILQDCAWLPVTVRTNEIAIGVAPPEPPTLNRCDPWRSNVLQPAEPLRLPQHQSQHLLHCPQPDHQPDPHSPRHPRTRCQSRAVWAVAAAEAAEAAAAEAAEAAAAAAALLLMSVVQGGVQLFAGSAHAVQGRCLRVRWV
eukprot:CAMPEP_0181209418 /NCGR_PEP_ID=MMETSP1096-20121128/22659_1 /TAXON_ID=156174 ORGANISM="Chrysochromulina ericina, Strain CCMP281" /NCGR_SAMPLE_ID=MMETSP1096 /ASSEMBLY_ACC=CAM_ASM_000453 /LENGTH=140 /DNA_ID=CAMNT_0023300585 /DNA_START=185 /DNA_END=606 /DNA_ORIENTATION=+